MKTTLALAATALALSFTIPASAEDIGATVGAKAGATVQAGETTGSVSGEAGTTLTLKDIDVSRPFGDTTFDRTKSPEEVDVALADDTQRKDIRDRCQLIVQSPDQFQVEDKNWCMGYLDWAKMKTQ